MSHYGHQSSNKSAKKPIRQVVREQWMAAFALVGVAIVGCYLPSTLERLEALEKSQQQAQPVGEPSSSINKHAGHSHINGVVDVVHLIEHELDVAEGSEATASQSPGSPVLNEKHRGGVAHDFRPKCCCCGQRGHDGHKPVGDSAQGAVGQIKHVAP